MMSNISILFVLLYYYTSYTYCLHYILCDTSLYYLYITVVTYRYTICINKMLTAEHQLSSKKNS